MGVDGGIHREDGRPAHVQWVSTPLRSCSVNPTRFHERHDFGNGRCRLYRLGGRPPSNYPHEGDRRER